MGICYGNAQPVTQLKKTTTKGNLLLNENELSNIHTQNINQNGTYKQISANDNALSLNGQIYGDVSSIDTNNTDTNAIQDAKYADLQRQIEILKECSNAEIKMLKSKIQTMEKQFKQNIQTHSRKEEMIECTESMSPTQCPHILRLIRIAQIYKQILQQNRQVDELEIWNTVHSQRSLKQYNLDNLIDDYCHILQIHCNNNNIFELKSTYMELSDILGDCYENRNQCKCIITIENNNNNNYNFELVLNTIPLLDIIHCYLYHAYKNDDESSRKTRDCIQDKNDMILKHNKNRNRLPIRSNNDEHTPESTSGGHDNQLQLNEEHYGHYNLKDIDQLQMHSQQPLTLISPQSLKIITHLGEIQVDPNKLRHNSVTSVTSASSNGSGSRASKSTASAPSTLSSMSKDRSRERSPHSPLCIINDDRKELDDNDTMTLVLGHKLPKTPVRNIEESVDRVRKLSGTINPEQLEKLMIREYEENVDDDIDAESSDLDDDEKEEIQLFKQKQIVLEMEKLEKQNSLNNKERRPSNLFREKSTKDWNPELQKLHIEEMKKQLCHLAMSSHNMEDDDEY